jgi:hypothetical protein
MVDGLFRKVFSKGNRKLLISTVVGHHFSLTKKGPWFPGDNKDFYCPPSKTQILIQLRIATLTIDLDGEIEIAGAILGRMTD